MNKGWSKVTKEQFDAFVRGYQQPLVYDCYAACEPPLRSYNDFSDGKVWPESMVAYYYEGYNGGPSTYYIQDKLNAGTSA